MQLRIRVVMLVIAFAALRASATKFEATDPSTAEFPDAAEPFCLVEYNDGHQEDVCAKEAAEQAELHKKILAHKDPKEVYDLVIDIETIKSVLDRSSGWEVTIGEQAEKFLQPTQTRLATVVGRFKQGKTWLVSKLLKVPALDRPNFVTKGLSFIASRNAAAPLHLVDSAGSSTPVNLDIPDAVSDRNARFDLLEEVALALADVFIVVVDDLTWSDQEHLIHVEGVIDASLRYRKTAPKLVVFHNLKNIEYKRLDDGTTTLDYYLDNFRKLYRKCSNITLQTYPTLKLCRRELTDGQMVFHIFLARDVNEGIGYNQIAFAFFESIFTFVMEKPRNIYQDAISSIAAAMRRRYILPKDMDFNKLSSFKLGTHLPYKTSSGQSSPLKVGLLASCKTDFEPIIINPIGFREQHGGRQPFVSAFILPNERREVWIVAEAPGIRNLDQVTRDIDYAKGRLTISIQLDYTELEMKLQVYRMLHFRNRYFMRKPIEAVIELPPLFVYSAEKVEEWIHNGMYYLRLYDNNGKSAPKAKMSEALGSPGTPAEHFDVSPSSCAYRFKEENCMPLPVELLKPTKKEL